MPTGDYLSGLVSFVTEFVACRLEFASLPIYGEHLVEIGVLDALDVKRLSNAIGALAEIIRSSIPTGGFPHGKTLSTSARRSRRMSRVLEDEEAENSITEP